MDPLHCAIISLAAALGGLAAGYAAARLFDRFRMKSVRLQAAEITRISLEEAEKVKKEAELKGKEELYKKREEFDRFFKGNEKREAAFAKRGSVIVGDVHPAAFEVSGAYTPVPGGVGLLTIAMLMANTVRAAKMRRGL